MMRYPTDLCRPVPQQHSGDTPPEQSTITLHLERNVISFHNRATGINAWCDTLMNVHTKRWSFLTFGLGIGVARAWFGYES
jgi:hypothetical protein